LAIRRCCAGIEGEHRHVNLLHHRAQQRRGFDSSEPLVVERFGQRVDLGQRGAERVVWVGRPAADAEIVFAERGQQVGQRLERHHDARPHRGGESDQQREIATVSVHCTFGV
jgi:hypothetical protein